MAYVPLKAYCSGDGLTIEAEDDLMVDILSRFEMLARKRGICIFGSGVSLGETIKKTLVISLKDE